MVSDVTCHLWSLTSQVRQRVRRAPEVGQECPWRDDGGTERSWCIAFIERRKNTPQRGTSEPHPVDKVVVGCEVPQARSAQRVAARLEARSNTQRVRGQIFPAGVAMIRSICRRLRLWRRLRRWQRWRPQSFAAEFHIESWTWPTVLDREPHLQRHAGWRNAAHSISDRQ